MTNEPYNPIEVGDLVRVGAKVGIVVKRITWDDRHGGLTIKHGNTISSYRADSVTLLSKAIRP
tara:strand:+ start:945 stop:1133 length:189 start_codon:yes stop_codon:yes gene_type:complete